MQRWIWGQFVRRGGLAALAATIVLIALVGGTPTGWAPGAGVVQAGDDAQISASWGDSWLRLTGSGFEPNEVIHVVMTSGERYGELDAHADAKGEIEVLYQAVGLFRPGQRVDLEGHGDKGSVVTTAFVIPASTPLPTVEPRTTPGATPERPAANTPAGAPIADVSGPGQSVSMPAAQCPRTLACRYGERAYHVGDADGGYRVQALTVCGANCTTQYWVSSLADGSQLVATDPVRGGGLVTIGQADEHPPVRTVLPHYGPADPACCPSGLDDTTYTWDSASGTLVPGDPAMIPSADRDTVRQQLKDEGFDEALPGF